MLPRNNLASNYLEMSTDLVITHRNGEIMQINQAGLKMLGYINSVIVGRHCLDFIHPRFRNLAADRINHFFLDYNEILPDVEIQVLTASKRYIWLESRSKMIMYQGKPAILAVGKNCDRRKQVETILARSLIGLLPDRLGELWTMQISGMGHEEIMKTMKMDSETVKRYKRRLQQKICERLGKDSYEKINNIFQ